MSAGRALFWLLLALLVAACSASRCYTHVAELADTDMALVDGAGARTPLWHTNHRSILAASASASARDLALLSVYADAPSAVVLESFAIDPPAAAASASGAPVVLEYRAPAPPPASMCLASGAVFVLEQDGRLLRHSRANGSALPVAPAAEAERFEAIACAAGRLFALARELLLELGPADAAPIATILRLPAPRALAVAQLEPLVLQVELGAPAAYAALVQVDARSVLAFSDLRVPVSSDSDSDSACVIERVDPVRGLRTGEPAPGVPAPCRAAGAGLVVADGLVWLAGALAAPPKVCAGALLNGANLNRLQGAAAPAMGALAVFDDAGRGALLAIATAAAPHVTRLPSLSGVRPLRLLSLEPAAALWLDAQGRPWLRPGPLDAPPGPDVALDGVVPPGEAVLDGITDADGSGACLLTRSGVHCLGAATSASLPPGVPATAALLVATRAGPALLAAEPARRGLVFDLGEWSAAAVYEPLCTRLELPRRYRSDGGSVARLGSDLGWLRTAALRWGPGMAAALDAGNCTVTPLAAVDPAADVLALAGVPGAACLAPWPTRHRRAPVLRNPALLATGLALVACGICGVIGTCVVFETRRRTIKRVPAQHRGEWGARGPGPVCACLASRPMQLCAYRCLCCLPALRNRVTDWQMRQSRRGSGAYDEMDLYGDRTSMIAGAASYRGQPPADGMMHSVEIHDN